MGSQGSAVPVLTNAPGNMNTTVIVVISASLFGLMAFLAVLHLYVKCVNWTIPRTGPMQDVGDESQRHRHWRDPRILQPGASNSEESHNWIEGGSSDEELSLEVMSGLDESVIELLPILVFRPETAFKHEMDCVVCLEEFVAGERYRVLPACCHSFHVECIDMWFMTHATCPLCRATVALLPNDDLPRCPRPRRSASNFRVTSARDPSGARVHGFRVPSPREDLRDSSGARVHGFRVASLQEELPDSSAGASVHGFRVASPQQEDLADSPGASVHGSRFAAPQFRPRGIVHGFRSASYGPSSTLDRFRGLEGAGSSNSSFEFTIHIPANTDENQRGTTDTDLANTSEIQCLTTGADNDDDQGDSTKRGAFLKYEPDLDVHTLSIRDEMEVDSETLRGR